MPLLYNASGYVVQRHSSAVRTHVRWVAIIADDDLMFDYKYNYYFIFIPFSAHNTITVEWASVWFMEPFDCRLFTCSRPIDINMTTLYFAQANTNCTHSIANYLFYLSKSILHSDFRIIRMEQLKYTFTYQICIRSSRRLTSELSC